MSLDLLNTKGYPLEKQLTSWRGLVQEPISKLNDDAFTRIRIILMNGVELEAIQFKRACARANRDLRLPLAQIRRVEHQQATSINWLLGADHSPIETTIAYEQVAIEVTAAVAQIEPDPYLAQAYRFGLLEDFDHLYRYSALLDRLEGKDANNILQSYTDVIPGRPTVRQHRHPVDDVRQSYDRQTAAPLSKMNALTITSAEQQTWNYYMNIGPLFADPVARLLYAEIASIEEQHVTQYESLLDPDETWLEKWLLHEANEVYNYYSCVQSESDPRVKALWERYLEFELGHLNLATELFKKIERRDPAEVLPAKLPEPISFKNQRDFVRQTLRAEVDLSARRTEFVDRSQESQETRRYRDTVNAGGTPTEIVSVDYVWAPGGEINRQIAMDSALQSPSLSQSQSQSSISQGVRP